MANQSPNGLEPDLHATTTYLVAPFASSLPDLNATADADARDIVVYRPFQADPQTSGFWGKVWDVFPKISTFISTVIVSLVGVYFTNVYRSAELASNEQARKAALALETLEERRLSELQTHNMKMREIEMQRAGAAQEDSIRQRELELMKDFVPHLAGESTTSEQRQTALVLIQVYARNKELALRLTRLLPGPGAGKWLDRVKDDVTTPEERRLLADARSAVRQNEFQRAQNAIPELARKLHTRWKDVLSSTELSGLSDVEAGLRILLQSGALDPSLVATDDPVAVAASAIKHFQQLNGKGTGDGILGKKTLALLRSTNSIAEPQDLPNALIPTSQARLLNEGRRTPIIFWYVDSSVPERFQDVPVEQILVDAWNLWEQHANIKMVMVKDRVDANVVISARSLGDGPGGTLGTAHHGGPSVLASRQLSFSFDNDEPWTPKRARIVACHFFGRILGLGTSPHAGNIMSPFVDEAISEPQRHDVVSIQEIWGTRPQRDVANKLEGSKSPMRVVEEDE